jgi:N-acyl-D-aspartate/D-glutamate deacylase
MGERAFDGPATEEDLNVMKRELSDALRAGAIGFSTSRSTAHATSDSRPVASRLAQWDEVAALVNLVGRESTAVFQLAHENIDPQNREQCDEYYRRIQDLALSSGVPIVFGLMASVKARPWVRVIEETVGQGGQMYGLTHCRNVSTVQSFKTSLTFDTLPEWRELRSRPLDEQRSLLLDADVRSRLVRAAQIGDYGERIGAEPRRPDYGSMYVMNSTYLPNPTVAEEALRLGIDPVEFIIDLALERDFEIYFYQPLVPQSDDALVPLMKNPNTAMTFSDSGAHVSQILDVSIPTHLLAYWVRERQALTLEEAIAMITRRPAQIFRLHDRGLLAPGYAADITVFDPTTVAPLMPRVVNDLPGGVRRLVQKAEGYVATVVNGQVFTRDGEATEARSGSLLRAGQIPVPA